MPIGSKRHAEGPGNTELRYKVGMWAAIRAWKLGGKLESCDNFCQIQSPKGDLTHFSKYSKILTLKRHLSLCHSGESRNPVRTILKMTILAPWS